MRTVVRAAIAFAATLLASASVHAATIKLATWNLNNLHHVLGEPLRSGAPARTEEDYRNSPWRSGAHVACTELSAARAE